MPTFVSKVMPLLFNMLSRLVIAFLPRSKHLLISCLQWPSAVILESKKIKSITVSIVSPSIFHEVNLCQNPSVSFSIDWFDLLAVQGTLKNLQHHSSKTSILQCSAFFIIQLLHSYMTIGKTITLTRQTFVGKVMSLLFNMLSRLVIAFLPRSKHPLISWLQPPSAVILEPKKIKSLSVSIVFPSICMKWWDWTP